MKTFADVKFNNNISGVFGTINLNNGYEIVITMAIFGSIKGKWQLSVFPINSRFSLFMKCLGNYNLSDYLTFSELEEKIIEVQNELNNMEK